MSLWQLFILASMIYIAPHLGEKTGLGAAWLCLLIALIAIITGATP